MIVWQYIPWLGTPPLKILQVQPRKSNIETQNDVFF